MKLFLRLLLVVFFLSSGFTALATKLYWVGGSGNFNDPAHWSMESGGVGGVKTPAETDDVFFDEHSFPSRSVINFVGQSAVGSLTFSDNTYPVTLVSNQNERLFIFGSIKLNPFVENQFTGDIHLMSSVENTEILFGLSELKGNLYFDGNGSWDLRTLLASDNSEVHLNNGKVILSNGAINAGSLLVAAPGVLEVNESVLKTTKKLIFSSQSSLVNNGIYIEAPVSDPSNFDLGGNSVSQNRIIDINSPMSCAFTFTIVSQPKCATSCDGVVKFTLPATCAGTAGPNYSATWSGLCALPVGTPATNLPAGVYTQNNVCGCGSAYTVIFRDNANSFAGSASVNITAPSSIQQFYNSVSPLCNGACNGKIFATIIGGTQPYTVKWLPGPTTHTNNFGSDSITGLCVPPASYTIVVTDGNNCVDSNTTTITQPTTVSPNGNSSAPTCFGVCNGYAWVAPSGGTPFGSAQSNGINYTTVWDGNAAQNNDTLKNLCANSTHTCVVTDKNGCTASFIVTIGPGPLAITFTKNPASGLLNIACNNTCDGSIGVTGVSGGTGAYTFSWTPSGGSVSGSGNSSTYSNLCGTPAGKTYTCTITDANGCPVTATFTITSPSALSNTVTVTQPKCVAGQGSSTGSATVTASGGVAGYGFAWSPTVTTSGSTPTSIGSSMSPGTYTVIVTDANNCLDTANVTITAPPALSGTMTTVTNPTCPNLNNGHLCVTASGGTGAYGYAWLPTGGTASCTPSTLTVTPGGTSIYTVTVSDVNSCTVAVTSTLTSPPQATINAAITNPPCAGTCNGSATLTPSGGTGPYTYAWSCSATTLPTISGRCGGTSCSYTVTDAGTSCKYTGTVSFTVAPTLSLSLASTALTCDYSCNSTITSTVSGGTPAYTYSWIGSGVGPGPTQTNMCKGTYTAQVTDNLGCVITKTVSVTGPAALSNTVTVTNPKCTAGQGPSVGTATVTASGGTAGYTFTWTPGPTVGACASPKTCASNIAVGTYTVYISDANNCLDTATVTLNPPTAVSGTITTTTNPTCPNLNNGQLCVTAGGGTVPYSYAWTPTGGTGSCSAASLTVTAGGTSVYSVTVSDLNTCTVVVTGTLTSPPQATVTSAVTDVKCGSTPCTASATLTPSGGTGPFTYAWSCSGTTTPIVSNQCAGTTCNYTVTDAGTGCKYTGSVTFAPAPAVLNASISASALSCAGDCNSVITSTVTGGTPGYGFSWVGTGANPVNPTSTTQSNMCAGGYTVTVTDAQGCTKTANVTITAPPAITVTLNATQPNCSSSCNGSINAVVTGGTGNNTSTVNWSPSVAPNPPSTLNPTGLCGSIAPGTTYTLTVTDANGCPGTGTTTIIAPTVLTVTVSQTDVTCNGLCNGSATATASGGTNPYTYSWDGGPYGNSTTTSGLCAGSHTLTVKDNNACTASQIITITQPNGIQAGVINVQNTCGPCTGSAEASPIGGTPPYTYTWSPAGGNGPIADSLCIGNYTLTVGDSHNCPTSSATFTITPIVVINISATSQSVSCSGACDGIVSATASSGSAPYTMTWSVSPTYTQVTSCTSVSTCSVGGLCSGTYVVHAVDQNGCVNKDSISIGNPPLLTATVTSTNASCFGTCNGSATVTPGGGTAPYTVTWSTGASGTTINNLCPGPYTVTVIDNRGCSVVQTFTVNSNSQLSYSTSNTAPIACAGTNGSLSITGVGGTAPYTFTWNPTGGGTVTTVSPTSTLSAIAAGVYSVTITDMNGCDTTVQLTLSDPGSPTIAASTTSVSCFGICDGTATVTAVSAQTMSWQFGTGPSPLTQSNMCAGTYSVQATDINGCSAFQNVTINGPSQITDQPVSMVNPGCSGATGSIQVTPGGGNGTPYTFNWDSGAQSTNPATGLSAGVHTVVITDGTGCSQTFTDTLKSTTQPTLAVNSTSPTCSYLANGVATATVTGGVPQYTLTWTGASSGVVASGANATTASNLAPDSYTVSVVDSVGCTTQQTFTITAPSAIAPNFSKTDNLCNGVCTGSATVAPSGGTPSYTYQWLPIGQNTPTVSNLCAQNYTVIVKDNNNCSDTTRFTIVDPPSLTVTATQNNVSCNAACTGTATLAISGGTPGYAISWSPNVCPNCTTVANLCAGTYVANVTDTNGCAVVKSITIVEPSPILSSLSATSPLCVGNCNGSIHDTTSGGVGPYTYTWSPTGGTVVSSTSSSTYSGLCVGNYTVITTDANGCHDTASATISNPTPPGICNYITNPATCGQSDGSVSITCTTGAQPVTINWLAPSTCGTSTVCTNMAAGIYSVEVTDANGCKDTTFIPVANPTGPQIDSVVTHVNCNGDSTGSIQIIVTSGVNQVTPYTFTWTPAGTVITTSNSSTNSGLGANVYLGAVGDSLGCVTITSFTITEPPKLQDNGNSMNATCQGINDGSITSVAAGGTPSMAGGTATYTYTLDGITTNTTGVFNGLAVGQHTVCISDSLGCSVCNTYNINGTIVILSSVNSTNINCNGICNGTATLSQINGGAAPYVISWSNMQTTAVLTNLCAGGYTATITDTNGCQATQSVTITQPAKLTVSTAITAPSCGQCNGSIAVTPSGGTPSTVNGYTYQWNVPDTTSTINNVCAALYQVNVTDSLGCQQSFQIPISNDSVPNTATAVTSPVCGSGCTGSATVTATGNAPFAYFWPIGGQTTPTISGQCAGLYFVQVKDSLGCISTDSVQIAPGTVLNIHVTMINPPCNDTSGVIMASVSGGAGPYSFNWLPGNLTNDTISNLPAGIYTLTVTDGASGCSKDTVIGLNNNSNGPTLTFATTNITCNGLCNGSATVTASNSVAPYTYQWTNGQTTSIISGLCDSSYAVLVTDNLGCIQTGQITITQPNMLIASIPITSQINCSGNCNGAINVVVSGGTPGYSYSWSPATISGSSASNLCAGNYSVMVTDTNGCMVNIFDTLVSPPALVITGTVTPATCSNASDGAINTTTTGGVPAYSWQWSGGSAATTASITNIQIGTYTVVVTDLKNCTDTASFNVNPTVTITVNAGNDTTACGISSITLNGTVSAGTTVQWAQVPNPPGPVIGNSPSVTVNPVIGTTQYVLIGTNGACSSSDTISVTSNPLPTPDAGIAMSTFTNFSVTLGGNPTNPSGGSVWWSPGFGLNDSTVTNPVVTSPLATTTYTVYETNSFGCVAMDTITVTVLPTFIIPNGFTPNGDGYNDTWIIDNIQLFPDCEVEVFNRWGEPLFYSKGYNTPWNGTYGGKPVPVGTYYYLIRLHDKEKKFPDHYTGPLTILR